MSAADEEELSAAHRGRGQAGKIEKFQFVGPLSVSLEIFDSFNFTHIDCR